MVNVFQEILRNYPTRTSKNCGTPNYRMDLGTSDLPTHATFHGAFRSAVRFLPLLNNIYALSPVGVGHFIDRYLWISLKEVIAAAAIIELKSHLLPRKSNTLSSFGLSSTTKNPRKEGLETEETRKTPKSESNRAPVN